MTVCERVIAVHRPVTEVHERMDVDLVEVANKQPFVKVPVREQMISVRARVKAVRERTVLNTRSRTDSTRSRTVDPCSRTGGVRVWGATYTAYTVRSILTST